MTDDILALHDRGMSVAAIAHMTGSDVAEARRRLMLSQRRPRERGRAGRTLQMRIIAVLDEHGPMTIDQLGEHVGRYPSAVEESVRHR